MHCVVMNWSFTKLLSAWDGACAAKFAFMYLCTSCFRRTVNDVNHSADKNWYTDEPENSFPTTKHTNTHTANQTNQYKSPSNIIQPIREVEEEPWDDLIWTHLTTGSSGSQLVLLLEIKMWPNKTNAVYHFHLSFNPHNAFRSVLSQKRCIQMPSKGTKLCQRFKTLKEPDLRDTTISYDPGVYGAPIGVTNTSMFNYLWC